MALALNTDLLLKFLAASLEEIASALGAQWPTFSDRLRELAEQLAQAPDVSRARVCTNALFELGLRSPAKSIFVGLMSQFAPPPPGWDLRGDTISAPLPGVPPASSLEDLHGLGAGLLEALAHKSTAESIQWDPFTPLAYHPDDSQSVPSVPTELLAGTPPRPASSAQADPVDCAVFAPPSAAQGSSLLVQVFFYCPEQEKQVRQRAAEADADAQRRGFATLEMDIPRGTRLWVRLELPGLVVDQPEASLVWRGRPCAAQFGIRVPADHVPETVIGKVLVALDGMPIGGLRFKLEVAPGAREAPRPLSGESRRFRKAFISSSHHDLGEVLKRVQMLKANRIECFQYILELEPGEIWEQRMYREIEACDVFYLFWSSASKSSVWVRKEIDHALQLKNGDDQAPPEIVPIPIEGPPIPAPPDDLQHIHFYDSLLDHIKVASPR